MTRKKRIFLVFLLLISMLSTVLSMRDSFKHTVKADVNTIEFIEEHKKEIIASSRKTGVWASVTAAQLVVESGTTMSKLAEEDNNLFGIKWSDSFAEKYPGAYAVTYSTREVINGQSQYINAEFTHFPSIKDCITEHSIIWWNGYYETELEVLYDLNSSVDSFIRAVSNGSYCTATDYYDALTSVIKTYNFEELDKLAFPNGRQYCGYGGRTVGNYNYPDDGYNDDDVESVATRTTSDGESFLVVSEKDLVGMLPEQTYMDSASKISLPDFNNLTYKERLEIENLRAEIELEKQWSFYDNLRVLFVFIGICLMYYAVLFIICFIFDKANNFFEISLISVITIGKLIYSDEKEVSNQEVNFPKLIRIELALWVCGFILVSGSIFSLMGTVLSRLI